MNIIKFLKKVLNITPTMKREHIIGYINWLKDTQKRGENIIKCWEEKGEIYLHIKGRSGMYYIEYEKGKRINFLVDIFKINDTKNKEIKNKKETIYRFMDIT